MVKIVTRGIAGFGLGLCLALAPAASPAEEEAPAPTGKTEEMKAPAKLEVDKPMSQERDPDAPKIQAPGLQDDNVPMMSVDQYRLHILKQEMEYNPEIKEKVEMYVEMMKQKQLLEQQVRAKNAMESTQPQFKGWMFDNLRKLYQAQGKELPDLLKTADQFNRMEQRGKDPDWTDANSPEEYLSLIKKQQEFLGMRSDTLTDGLSMVEDAGMPSSEKLMGMSLSDRLRVNRTRFEKARQEEEELMEPEEDPESDNELLTFEKGEAEEELEDETLAYIESESAKETFGPGQLMWFENKDDTLPVAGPAARGIPRGELENTWQELEELTADLDEEVRQALPHRTISAENFNRPGVDIPVATFVENARIETEEVRKAEMIQESLERSKENRRRMLRPNMDVYSIRRFMVPHDLLGPNAFRAWDDSRFEKPKKP